MKKFGHYCPECRKVTFHTEYNKGKDGFCDLCGKLNIIAQDRTQRIPTYFAVFAIIFYIVGLLLLGSISWKIALGVFLIQWANNLDKTIKDE